MRNIMLHAVVRGEAGAAGGLARAVVAGHAFGLERVSVTVEGPDGGVEAEVPVDPRTHQWVAVFTDVDGLRRAGVVMGRKVRAVAADAADPAGCYSSTEAVVSDER